MPFTYRDKPNLAERLRGKIGEDILNELKSDLDTQGRRRMFFDSPSWRTRHTNTAFPRGFPFDDDQNRINIRTYLDEIASRHPEFADQLRERPWTEDFVDPSFKKSRSDIQSNQGNEASGSSQGLAEEKQPPQNLTNFGLRNTVPLGPGANPEQSRQQRSMSAPPENRGAVKNKRFVTKCEIPVMNNPTQDHVQVKPDLAGRGPQESAPTKGNAPNVRVIPIQVEGRDTPLVNTNIDTTTNFAGETFMEPSFEGRLPRDFGSYQRHSPRFAHKERAPTPPQYQYAPQYQQYVQPPQHFGPPQQPQFMAQQHFAPPEQQAFGQTHQHLRKPHAPAPPQQQQQQYQKPPQQQQYQKPPQQQPQHQQQQQQQQPHQKHCPKPPQAEETNLKPPPPKPEPVKDPIEKVQAIQKDVEELMKQVEAFKGNSRTDKQYLMLDELLTRQLLLLDVIDTEGKENVRQARKDTIRSIQRCISTLENKVPLVENRETAFESQGNQEEGVATTESGGPQPMNVDNTKENTPVENKECQKMEVDEQANSELPQNQQPQPQPQAQAQSQQPVQQEQHQEQKKEGNSEKNLTLKN